MIACFEIHDSTLTELVQEGCSLTLRLKAMRIEWPTAMMDSEAETFIQEIQLDFESASITKDGASNPVNLLDGSFRADHHDGVWDDESNYLIPASLKTARGVRMILAGTDEANQDYITMKIDAESMRLTPLGKPRFLQTFRPDPPKGRTPS